MLDAEELQELEATLLPTLERHHLRLLAHGLRTLQAIAGRRGGALPPAAAIEVWARSQPVIEADPGFAQAFLTQMASVAAQLESIAAAHGRAPLALELPDLVAWARGAADQRLRSPANPADLADLADPAAPPQG
jgi:hypothetical protein